MIDTTALRSPITDAASGSAIVLRPDWTARRRAVVGSPAHLAAQADQLFARALARRGAPAAPGKVAAAMAAVARGVEAAGRPAPLHRDLPAPGAASWQPVAFVDPCAGLAALSASLAAVTHPRAAL